MGYFSFFHLGILLLFIIWEISHIFSLYHILIVYATKKLQKNVISYRFNVNDIIVDKFLIVLENILLPRECGVNSAPHWGPYRVNVRFAINDIAVVSAAAMIVNTAKNPMSPIRFMAADTAKSCVDVSSPVKSTYFAAVNPK